MDWNASLYDAQHAFVAEYGKALLEFVPENREQSILDLGCGTGALTARLADMAGRVVGVDSSPNMIETAKEQFPHLAFAVCDALDLPFAHEFDLVFSNAVFHWIHDHDALVKTIHEVLKERGLLVCEFGAWGNIATIEHAFAGACEERGYAYTSKFTFPQVKQFASLLEKHGFIIDRIYEYDRPTVLQGKEQGLSQWVKQFFASELAALPEEAQRGIPDRVAALTRAALWNGEAWIADYRRLRAVAHL